MVNSPGSVIRVADAFSLLEKNAPTTYAELQSLYPREITSRSFVASARAINVERQGSEAPDAEQLTAMLAACRATLAVSKKLLHYYVPRARGRLQVATSFQFYGQLIALICSLSIIAQIEKFWAAATLIAATFAAVGSVVGQWAQWRMGGKDVEGGSLYSIVHALEDADSQLIGLDLMLATLNPQNQAHTSVILADAALVNKVSADINGAVGNPRIYDRRQPDFSLAGV